MLKFTSCYSPAFVMSAPQLRLGSHVQGPNVHFPKLMSLNLISRLLYAGFLPVGDVRAAIAEDPTSSAIGRERASPPVPGIVQRCSR